VAQGRLHVHVLVPTGPHDGAGAADRLGSQLAALRSLGCSAAGQVVGARPVAAVRHALRNELRDEPFDEIVLATFPPSMSVWLGLNAAARIERLSRLPVTHVVVGERAAGPPGGDGDGPATGEPTGTPPR
jgi:hypothetical protein